MNSCIINRFEIINHKRYWWKIKEVISVITRKNQNIREISSLDCWRYYRCPMWIMMFDWVDWWDLFLWFLQYDSLLLKCSIILCSFSLLLLALLGILVILLRLDILFRRILFICSIRNIKNINLWIGSLPYILFSGRRITNDGSIALEQDSQ